VDRDAFHDDYIPPRARDALRDALGPSEHITLGHGHQIGFVTGMTLLSSYYLERAVVQFFEAAFTEERGDDR
jgi:hypothetical protein